MANQVSIIILNYQRYDDTIRCLSSLYPSDLPKGTKIIIVDNSDDKPKQDAIIRRFPNVYLIANRQNLGFAAGNNIGITYALSQGASSVLILNPDTLVSRDFIKPLIHTLQESSMGIVAPALKHKQLGHVVFGLEGSINWHTGQARHVNVSHITNTTVRTAEFVSFACVLIKSDIFKATGLLDEGYFMYLEDVDFCLRTRKAGFSIAMNSKVVVEHKTSSSFTKPTDKLPISFRSQLRFITKWLVFPYTIVAYIYTCLFYPYLYVLWTYHSFKHKYRRNN